MYSGQTDGMNLKNARAAKPHQNACAQIEARDSKGDTPLSRALGNSSNHLTSVRLGFLADVARRRKYRQMLSPRQCNGAVRNVMAESRREQTDPSFVAAKASRCARPARIGNGRAPRTSPWRDYGVSSSAAAPRRATRRSPLY